MAANEAYRIAIDARQLNTSTGRYLRKLIEYLAIIDDPVLEFIVLLSPGDVEAWTPPTPRFRAEVADFSEYSFAEQIGMATLLRRIKPDLVHFCGPQQPIFWWGRSVSMLYDLTLLRIRNARKPALISFAKRAIGWLVFWYVVRRSQAVMAPSQFTIDDLVRTLRADKNKMVLTYNAADKILADAVPLSIPFSQYILYVGSQTEYKNIRRLGEAHQKLLKKYPGLGLVLAGKLDDSFRENRRAFDEAGYENIWFTDYVSEGELRWLYENAAAYAFPSLMEGFGLPGLEAMLYGVPVASSDRTCLPEVYGDAAVYFDPLDPGSICAALDRILSRGNETDRLVEAGRVQSSMYSWQTMAMRTLNVYRSVLGL